MCWSRRNHFGHDHRAGKLDSACYVGACSGCAVERLSDIDHERCNGDPHLVGDGRGWMRCIRCVVRFESRQRNSKRGSTDCELEFLARVYRDRRYEFCHGNRHGAAGCGTDLVVCRFTIECDQRWHFNTDLEQHWCERLYRERRLDRRASCLGCDNGGAVDDRSDLYIGVHRRRRHGDTLDHNHDCSAESDADLHGIAVERGRRRELDIDVGC